MNRDLNPAAEGRRLRCITFDPQQVLALLIEGPRRESWTELQVEGVPEGAVVVGHGHSLQSNCFVLVVEHSSFDLVALNTVPPSFPATVTVRQRGKAARLMLPGHYVQ